MSDDASSPALTTADAQALRRRWFVYLDTLEPVQAALHAYCRKLTANLWDAEDLVQDTLLRGFAMTARGDFHGPDSPVRDPRAYLFRTATHLWLDQLRRARWRGPMSEGAEPAEADPDPAVAGDALGKAAALTSPQEFAAILLKDVYDFPLQEIADCIGTTPGTVKSALSRARRKMRVNAGAGPVAAATAKLVRALVDAMNARDVERILALLAESVKIDVCNVGGGRGRRGIWTEKTLAGTRFEYAEHDGAPLVLVFGAEDRVLSGIVRAEVDGAVATRLIDYHYAPDTIRAVAHACGLEARTRGHHQGTEALQAMVATTGLPWLAAADDTGPA